MARLEREYSKDDIDALAGPSSASEPVQGSSAPAAIANFVGAVGGGGSPSRRKSEDRKGKGKAEEHVPDSLLKMLAGELHLHIRVRAFVSDLFGLQDRPLARRA
jgi:hypothetical protein